jgi:hypothetical protein
MQLIEENGKQVQAIPHSDRPVIEASERSRS